MYKAQYETFGQRAHYLLLKSRRGERIGPGFRRFLVLVQFKAMQAEKLTVAEVAEFQGVSKTTVRKALWSLATDGYLVAKHVEWRSNVEKLEFHINYYPTDWPPNAYERLVNYTLYRMDNWGDQAEYAYLK